MRQLAEWVVEVHGSPYNRVLFRPYIVLITVKGNIITNLLRISAVISNRSPIAMVSRFHQHAWWGQSRMDLPSRWMFRLGGNSVGWIFRPDEYSTRRIFRLVRLSISTPTWRTKHPDLLNISESDRLCKRPIMMTHFDATLKPLLDKF